MRIVLEIVQGYSPSKDVGRELVVPDQTEGSSIIRLKDKQYAVALVGGDQLTVVALRRYAATQKRVNNALTVSYQLLKTGTRRCVFLK